MRLTFLFISMLVFHLGLAAQSAEEQAVQMKQDDGGIRMEPMDEGATPEGNPSRTGNWNFSVGTSYFYARGFGSGMNYFVAPTYSVPLNQRWSLHGGMIASQTRGLGSHFEGESLLPDSYSSMALFVAGSYQMSDRLMIHGTGVKQLLSMPVTPFSAYPMDHFSLGATYRLGNNITIGASVHMNNGMGTYTSPLNGTMFPPPFIW